MRPIGSRNENLLTMINQVLPTVPDREALRALYDEAIGQINADKRTAAEAYLRISKDKDSLDNILTMMNDPLIVYTTTPQNVMKYADFMYKTGAIKVKPESWKELFFPNAQGLPGS